MVHGENRALALISTFSDPNPALLKESYKTLWSCTYHGDNELKVIDSKHILSVVAMVPHTPLLTRPNGQGFREERFFLVEKPGLDCAHMGGVAELDDANNDDEDENE